MIIKFWKIKIRDENFNYSSWFRFVTINIKIILQNLHKNVEFFKKLFINRQITSLRIQTHTVK